MKAKGIKFYIDELQGESTVLEEIRWKIESLLFQYWEKLPGPKPTYTEWYYAEGRYHDLLSEGS